MSHTVPTRPPYCGERKLVISIDFGTSCSGTSWVLLEDDQVPHIWDVTGYEGQEGIQVPKVPTVLYYDDRGKMKAAGGQTLDKGIRAQAQQHQWTRVEWFKLLLRPDHLAKDPNRAPKTQIPRNKEPVDLIADFLRYMADSAQRDFLRVKGAEGKTWEDVKHRVTYILSHPNGWNTSEHSIMREAAINAQLVPNSAEGRDRIMFVSEGEASLHWCMSKGIGRGGLKVGSHFIVVGAGGGTIDISTFKTINTTPLEFEESHIPECHLQGSAFVTKAFRNYVEDKLKGSSFGNPDIIDRLVEDFDLQVKRNFRKADNDLHVKFGNHQENDPNLDIMAGELLVRGEIIAHFFEPACHSIDASVKAVVGSETATVVLVGGFAGNAYLVEEVKRRLPGPNIQVLSPNDASAKASANGVICFYLDRSVRARMARWSCGIPCVYDFDPKDPQHYARKSQVQTIPATGKQVIEGGFLVSLKKGTVVNETEPTRFSLQHSQQTQTTATLDIVLECYRGDVPNLKFRDEDRKDQFQELCRFRAVIPGSLYEKRKLKPKGAVLGKSYYVSYFQIVISFGTTELKCSIEWEDVMGGSQRRAITPIWSCGHIDSSRSSRSRPERRVLPQEDSSSIRSGKESFHKAETNPKHVRHVPPSKASSDGDLNTKLVMSFDLGTTFSAASWVLHVDSKDPHIWDVSEYREDLPAKVPTVLYYDCTGKLRAVGSATLDKRNIADALEHGWTRVEWIKLLLLPDSLAHQLCRAPKTEMPPNKKLVEIIADFLRYMKNLSLKHFYETMELDRNSSQNMEDRIIYIFSHPNGWNTSQHPLIREASILAGLVPDPNEGNSRIIFVSEAEASLHWCIDRRLAIRGLEVGSNYIVVDAGGGAINISSYRTVDTAPLKFEESSIPECHLEGSTFVTQAFRKSIQDKLQGSIFGNPDAVERMVKDFDYEVKHGFRDHHSDTFVKFGGSQDNDSSFGIDDGLLLVRGEEMAKLFEPACSAIVKSVKANIVPTAKTVAVLVGGLTGNQYLFNEVQRRLPGILVAGPMDATGNVTAHGAICFHLKPIVMARMATWTYGIPCVHDFDPNDPKHAQRKSRVQTNLVSGQQFIDGGFFVTLKRGTLVRATDLTCFPFWHSQPERTPTTLNICLEGYQGDLLDIKFRDEDCEEQFRELSWFKATIPETSLVRRVHKEQRKNKETRNSAKYYYVCNFHIVASLGAPETKFYIEWKDEKGRIQRGPIKPISNSVHVITLGFD